MIGQKSIDEMLEAIGFTHLGLFEVLVPSQQPELFRVFNDAFSQGIPVPTMAYIDRVIQKTGLAKFVINEIFLNAFDHGNHGIPYLPVSVKIFEGTRGNVLRVVDSGEGFDYQGIIRNMRAEQEYPHKRAGWGMGAFYCYPEFLVSFEGKGNIINVQNPAKIPASLLAGQADSIEPSELLQK
jgi:hypothetical protein